MLSRWLPRAVVIAAAATLTLFAAAPASAAVTEDVPLKTGHLGKTAGDFEQECDANQGGASPTEGFDVWVFNARSGEFVEVRVTFDGGAGPNEDVVIPDVDQAPYANGIASNGSDKAWVKVPAGWTIVSAEADIDWGDQQPKSDFVVTHTCPGTPDEDPECELGEDCDPGEEPCDETKEDCDGEEPECDERTEDCDGEETSTSTPPGNNLPKTGASLGGLITAGVVLVGGGVALLMFRRRRAAADSATEA
jgi:LPXTG-motif cell wall-anchored protein